MASKLRSVLGRTYSALAQARQAEADRIVRRCLKQYDDAQLTGMGWTTAEIKVIRETASGPAARY
jgi:hypothetical protein